MSETHPGRSLWASAQLVDLIEPRRVRRNPAEARDVPYIGMEDVEAHTMRLLGTVDEQRQIISLVDERLWIIKTVTLEMEQQLDRTYRLRQAILKRAFEGKLVPQDSSDEPASVLLERIRAARADQSGASRNVSPRRGRRKKTG